MGERDDGRNRRRFAKALLLSRHHAKGSSALVEQKSHHF